MYDELKVARRSFMRWSCQNGYVERGITLPKVGVTYNPGPRFDLWPCILFRRLEMVDLAVSLETPEELMKEAP